MERIVLIFDFVSNHCHPQQSSLYVFVFKLIRQMATARVGTLPIHASTDLAVFFETGDAFSEEDKAEFLKRPDAGCNLHNLMFGYLFDKMTTGCVPF